MQRGPTVIANPPIFASPPAGWRMPFVRVLALCAALVQASPFAQEAPTVTFEVERFVVGGANPLSPERTQAALAPFTGEYESIDGLLAASDALQSALRSAGHTFHRVVLPPQGLDGGVVTLEVVTFSLDEVTVEGNERYSDARILAALPALSTGGAPNLSAISRSLAVANQHPSRQLNLNFANSTTKQDSLAARVRVEEDRPYALFGSLNNIGTDESGNLRMTFGAQYSDLWRRDHIATATYTTSPDNADDVQQYGFSYQAPVYAWAGWFSGFYIHSDVDIGNVQDFFDIGGAGDFLGFSFKRWLMPVGRYRHALTIGLQDRRFDTAISNALTGLGLPSISTVVRSRPWSMRYEGGYQWSKAAFGFFVEFNQNLSFGGNNRDQDYERVRIGAEADWTALRFASTLSYELPRRFVGVLKISGQWADEPLIPGEQFGLGGEFTVRGFEERTVAGDDALLFNFELWSPPITRFYDLRFVAFCDVGHKHLDDPVIRPQIQSDTLSSAGLGLRLPLHESVQLAVDYGHTLASANGEASDPGNVKTHFTLLVRY